MYVCMYIYRESAIALPAPETSIVISFPASSYHLCRVNILVTNLAFLCHFIIIFLGFKVVVKGPGVEHVRTVEINPLITVQSTYDGREWDRQN